LGGPGSLCTAGAGRAAAARLSCGAPAKGRGEQQGPRRGDSAARQEHRDGDGHYYVTTYATSVATTQGPDPLNLVHSNSLRLTGGAPLFTCTPVTYSEDLNPPSCSSCRHVCVVFMHCCLFI
jgi:hypothetical protein